MLAFIKNQIDYIICINITKIYVLKEILQSD